MKLYIENHWKCWDKHGGHVILLGAQWLRGRSYSRMAYEWSADICILGFAFGVRK